jgi:hypothetical protein
MRKLATIQKIKSLTPIEGKDKIVLAPFELQNFCHELGFESVPFLRREKFQWKNVDEIVESAKGKSVFGDTPREGIVVRSEKWMPPDVLMSNQWSLKTINPDFMIRYGL